MFSNAYMEKDSIPSEADIEKTLGSTYQYFKALIEQTKGLNRRWAFSKAVGWSIKIYDAKKALCYIYISDGYFRVYMTLRESERDILMRSQSVRFLHKKLGESKQFSEGFAIIQDIKDELSAEKCSLFIREVMFLRLPAAKRKIMQIDEDDRL